MRAGPSPDASLVGSFHMTDSFLPIALTVAVAVVVAASILALTHIVGREVFREGLFEPHPLEKVVQQRHRPDLEAAEQTTLLLGRCSDLQRLLVRFRFTLPAAFTTGHPPTSLL